MGWYRFRGTWVGPQSLHSSIPPRKGAGSASSCGTPRSLRLSLPAPGPGRIGGVSTLKGGNVVLLIGGVLYLIWYTVVIHCMLSLNKFIYIYIYTIYTYRLCNYFININLYIYPSSQKPLLKLFFGRDHLLANNDHFRVCEHAAIHWLNLTCFDQFRLYWQDYAWIDLA